MSRNGHDIKLFCCNGGGRKGGGQSLPCPGNYLSVTQLVPDKALSSRGGARVNQHRTSTPIVYAGWMDGWMTCEQKTIFINHLKPMHHGATGCLVGSL
jgi:hypothetical protein